uniref:SCF E3 ubiquitin ligase complex F-box protein grrA n=1 Tax=Anthurium amnicola TaxID=1678845 RepID=A0A1D1XPN3_9ARAE
MPTKNKNKLPSLPSETIDDIFKHIHDPSTLYSCLFVNRTWCRKIVPILWARPKPLVYKESSSRSLIETYVSCFDKEEKAILFSEEDLSNAEHLKSPLFEYAVFLKELNYPLLRLAVRRCYRNLGSKEFSKRIKPRNPEVNPNRQVTIMKALCNLFMRMSRLESLVLDSYDDIPNVALFTRGQCFSNLINLRVLWTNFALNMTNFIKKLPQICTGLRDLVIEFDLHDVHNGNIDAENLASVIKAQQSLNTFELIGPHNQVTPILSALDSQIESLTSVKFSRIKYQWEALDILGKCSKLKSLDIVSHLSVPSQETNDESKTAAKGASFNLRSLKLSNQSPKLSAQVIKMGGSSLRSLSLNIVTPEIVSSILRSGTRITSLYLDISETPQLEFSQHLKIIEGLKSLNYLQLSSTTPSDINNLLSAMPSILPSTLRHLDIEQEFSLRHLGLFLIACKVPLGELTLFPNTPIDTSFLTEIIGYVKDKPSLKFLYLNLSWESGLVNKRFTREMTVELQKNLFTVDLDKLRIDEI